MLKFESSPSGNILYFRTCNSLQNVTNDSRPWKFGDISFLFLVEDLCLVYVINADEKPYAIKK